ncbi:TULIP family P47-like protein [Serratia nevei]|uniref:TULIP family P47-like protein n=1 Tax=Serratia nevei TaxID=2703794 RepID=UPI003F6D6927
MSNKSNVMQSGLSQPISLQLERLNESVRQTIRESSLYSCASHVYPSEEALKEARGFASTGGISLASAVTTNGWDSVSICRVSALNQRIALEKTYPDSIDTVNAPFALKAKFKAWSITTGGDGRNVKVRVPLGFGTYKGMNGKSYQVDGMSADVYVKLSYFPAPRPVLAQDGDYDLQVNTQLTDPDDPIAAVISLKDPNKVLPDMDKMLLRGLLEQWLNEPENLEQFDTLFSTVVINNMGNDSDEFKWLRATSMSYAYTDSGSEENSIFGVLAMTNERDATGLPNQMPALRLERDDNASFLISREIFVKYQLLPALPYIFEDTSADNYVLDASGTTIIGKNIKLEGIKVGAITYYPVVENFDINFDETYVRTECKVRTDISPGIVAYTHIVTKQTFELAVNSKGEQVMVYAMVGDPYVQNTTDIAVWVVVTEAIIALIGIVVTGVTGYLATKLTALIVGIVVAVVVATISIIIHVIIEKVITDGVTENVPPIAPMVKVAANQVKWPFCEPDAFVLTDILYSGALIFSGSLKLLDKFCIRDRRLTLAALDA